MQGTTRYWTKEDSSEVVGFVAFVGVEEVGWQMGVLHDLGYIYHSVHA